MRKAVIAGGFGTLAVEMGVISKTNPFRIYVSFRLEVKCWKNTYIWQFAKVLPQTAIVIAYPGLVTGVRRSAELWITVLVEVVCMVFFVRWPIPFQNLIFTVHLFEEHMQCK